MKISTGHNSVLGRNTYSILAVLLVAAFTAIGIYFATSEPITGDTFATVLRRFGTDSKTRMILAFILVDVITGIMCALRLRVFDIQRVADFYKSNVIPYILGYLLVWVLTLLGLDGVLPLAIQDGLASLGFGAIATSLTGSIIDNVQRMSTKLSYTDTLDQVAEPPANPMG